MTTNTFRPTHRITFTPATGTPQTWDVMALEPGPAYTQDEWDATESADWERDAEGRFWFRGEAAPGNGAVTVVAL